MNKKSWWQSKTLWVNILTIAAGTLQQISGKNIVPNEYIVIGLAVVNMILRTVTTQPVGK